MKTTFSIILLITTTFLFTSCYTNRKVVSADQKSLQEKMERVIEKIKPGDMIDLVINNKEYKYKMVTKIMEPYVVIYQSNAHGGNTNCYIRIDQIESLILHEEYKEAGIKITGLMILFYLIAI